MTESLKIDIKPQKRKSKTTEQLREKITRIEITVSQPRENIIQVKELGQEVADQILASVKKVLPELAKEAGYVKLANDQSTDIYYGEVADVLPRMKRDGWRKVEVKIEVNMNQCEFFNALTKFKGKREQLVLICESIGVDFNEMKELGMEKALERFIGKEKK